MFFRLSVDTWSIGCIFGELIRGRVLFPGTDHIDQWSKIVDQLGTPGADFLQRLQPTVRAYVENRPFQQGYQFDSLFPNQLFPQDIPNGRLTGTQNKTSSRRPNRVLFLFDTTNIAFFFIQFTFCTKICLFGFFLFEIH